MNHILQFENVAVILPNMAEIMEMSDKSMLSLIVSSFVRNNADITAEQLAGMTSFVFHQTKPFRFHQHARGREHDGGDEFGQGGTSSQSNSTTSRRQLYTIIQCQVLAR